jgi:hypothetical protein
MNRELRFFYFSAVGKDGADEQIQVADMPVQALWA